MPETRVARRLREWLARIPTWLHVCVVAAALTYIGTLVYQAFGANSTAMRAVYAVVAILALAVLANYVIQVQRSRNP